MMNGTHTNHRAGAWFLVGLAAGGAMAVLLTPQSGPDLRRRIKGEIDQKTGQAEEWLETGKRRVKEQARKVDSALHAARDAYREQPSEEMA